MKFTHRAEYPADPETVFAAMTEQSFQDAACEATTTGTWTATVEESGGRTVISTERVLPTDNLPDIARGFVGDTLTVIESQTWGPAAADGSRSADLNLHIKGAPMTLRGTITLAPTATGSVEEIDAELKAGVPLIGGKLEKAAAEPLRAGVQTTTDLLRDRVS
ncbi:uncharacterized protein DUF2505 [Knoellia remsis]|uniref:Uncharacterized protein DUF2505 n=1 Tax=Knoellia remsis TaxID=407159 RepID=A0A2T0UTL5_9MICO|nr:DUF2505 domain-containing protein [Knoellia remsis]PRY61265.1 uncharacterized protein DUF2505 [Knoellia remsis]